MRTGLTDAGRLVASISSAVFLGVWINMLSDRLPGQGYLAALIELRGGNLLFAGSVLSLIGNEYIVRRRSNLEHERFEQRYELLRQRLQRLLENTLKIVCELISKTLRVRCNARYFIARADRDGRVYLEQDRDLAVLNIIMPKEFGFTRVAVDTPHIVSGRAYRERTPVYEELPVDHSDLYDPRIAQMIEPAQRWVLACPVLALDPDTNRHDDDHTPHGVIVFYGTELPPKTGVQNRIDTSLTYAQQFADQMSHMLNMLDLTERTGTPDGLTDDRVP